MLQTNTIYSLLAYVFSLISSLFCHVQKLKHSCVTYIQLKNCMPNELGIQYLPTDIVNVQAVRYLRDQLVIMFVTGNCQMLYIILALMFKR